MAKNRASFVLVWRLFVINNTGTVTSRANAAAGCCRDRRVCSWAEHSSGAAGCIWQLNNINTQRPGRHVMKDDWRGKWQNYSLQSLASPLGLFEEKLRRRQEPGARDGRREDCRIRWRWNRERGSGCGPQHPTGLGRFWFVMSFSLRVRYVDFCSQNLWQPVHWCCNYPSITRALNWSDYYCNLVAAVLLHSGCWNFSIIYTIIYNIFEQWLKVKEKVLRLREV